MEAPPVPSPGRWDRWRSWALARRADLVELGAVGVLTTWVLWPFLGLTGYPTSVDTVLYSGPNHAVNLEAWRDLRVPFWNADIFGGVPHLANEQAGALYPLKLLVVGFGPARGMGLLVAVHLVLLAVGLWWLARRTLGLAVPAGFVAAAAGVAGGVLMIKSLQFEQLLVMAPAPLLLVAIDALLDRSRRPWLPAAATAGLTTLVLLAGHPQIVYVLVPLVAVWVAGRTADRRSPRRLLAVAGVALLGALLAAVQLVPTLGLVGRTEATATERTEEELSQPEYVLDPSRVVEALLGDATHPRPVGISGSAESSSFVGAATVALAALGTAVAWRSRRRWTVVLLAAASIGAVLLSFGPRFALYGVLLDVVPGFGLARVPARWLVVWALAVPVLAAVGTDALSRRDLRRREVVGAVAGVALLLLVAVAGPAPVPPLQLAVLWAAAAGLVVLASPLRQVPGRWAALALALPALVVGFELAAPSARSEARLVREPIAFESYTSNAIAYLDGRDGKVFTMTFDRFDDPAYLVGALRPNANVLPALATPDGYDGGLQVTRRWSAMADTFSPEPFDRDLPLRNQIELPLDAEHLARLGVRWALVETAVLTAEQQVPGWDGPLATDGTVQLFENPRYVGEAVRWPATVGAADPEEAAALAATGRSRRAAVVEPGGPALSCTGRCRPTAADVERPSAGEVVVRTEGDGPALVTVAEQFDPGWSATVDGAPATVVAADGFLAAVEVPAGAHEIRLTYEPPRWTLAVVVSLLAALVTAALVVVGVVRRRSGDPAQPDRPADVAEEAGQDPLEERPLEAADEVVPHHDLPRRVLREEGP